MIRTCSYSFSFTAASLRLNEMVKVAKYAVSTRLLTLEGLDIKSKSSEPFEGLVPGQLTLEGLVAKSKSAEPFEGLLPFEGLVPGYVFGSVKVKSAKTQFIEIRKRLITLTLSQLEILANSDLQSQKQMALLAVCKNNGFIRDFIIEVIREKILVYDYQLTQADYISFLKNKQQLDPDLETFSDSTLKKARQVMFHILQQAGIIDNITNKNIQPQLLSSQVIKAIAADDRNLLKIFLYPDRDIIELMY